MGSVHAIPSSHPPIDMSINFPAHMSAKSPSNISPNFLELISKVSKNFKNFTHKTNSQNILNILIMSELKIVVYIRYFAGLLLVLAKLHMTLFMT